MEIEEKYQVNGVSLERIRNRNEVRVVKAMRNMLPEQEGFCGCRVCIEDVYAATASNIPAHYVQFGAIILHPKLPSEEDLMTILADSFAKVREHPNHPVANKEPGPPQSAKA